MAIARCYTYVATSLLPFPAMFDKTLLLLVPLVTIGFAVSLVSAAEPAPSITEHVAWKFPMGKEVTAAPLVADGVVYCGSTNGVFFALDAASGQQLWKFSRGRIAISSKAAVFGETVYFVSANTLVALDRTSGTERWQFVAKPFRPIYSMDLTDYHRSAPVVADGVVYFGDDWGNINGVDAATGALVFQFTTETGRPIRCTPLVTGGNVYFGDWEGTVYGVSLAEKQVLWTYTLENTRLFYGAVVSEFVMHDGVIYFGSQHDIFTPLDAKTGAPVWKYVDPNRTYLPSTPVIHNGRAIIASTIKTNSVLCLEQGRAVWACKLAGIFFTKPVIAPPYVIINSTDFGKTGHLYLIDVENGALAKSLPIERASPSAPTLVGDFLYLGAGDGCLYALRVSDLLAPAP
jgi:eukaryotic-like serine/threonine-protein kinase